MVEYLAVAAALLTAITLLLTSPVAGTGTRRIDDVAQRLMGKVRAQTTFTNLGDGRTADPLLQ